VKPYYVDGIKPKEPALRSAGLKSTAPRKLILDIIRSSHSRHLTVEDVYRQIQHHGSDVGLATVYRVLSQLEGAGLLSRNAFDGGRVVYELNEGHSHDHLICLGCGRVDEFKSDVIDAVQQEIAAMQGYRLTDHRLALYGQCPDCVGQKRPSARSL
jgi:Fur family transcriptional regulator, ferric uptake regulator